MKTLSSVSLALTPLVLLACSSSVGSNDSLDAATDIILNPPDLSGQDANEGIDSDAGITTDVPDRFDVILSHDIADVSAEDRPSDSGTDRPDSSDGTTSDDRPPDASPLDLAPRCSAEVDPTAGQGSALGYPRAVVIPFGGFADAGTVVSVDTMVTWRGIRALSVPVSTPCSIGPATSAPCEIRDALILEADTGERYEVLTSTLSMDLASVAVGLRMRLQMSAAGFDSASRLQLAGPDGTVFLLIERTNPGTHRFGPFVLSRLPESPTCVSAVQPTCLRILVSEPLRVSPANAADAFAPFMLLPMESQVVATSAGRYRVTHRATVSSARSMCSAPPVQYSEFEFIRLGES